MDQNVLQGKWKQLKGEVQKQWGKLTDDDMDRINGNYQQLVGRVQERYGLAREKAESQVAEWMDNLNDSLNGS
jgi:uncharacterized protein YjbJ (UPF0337 family)